MKKLIFTSALLLCSVSVAMLLGFIPKPEIEKPFLIMKVVELESNNWLDNMILIIKEDGTQEKLELKGIKRFAENETTIYQTINNIRAKGYKTVFITGGDYITTYHFQKE